MGIESEGVFWEKMFFDGFFVSFRTLKKKCFMIFSYNQK